MASPAYQAFAFSKLGKAKMAKLFGTVPSSATGASPRARSSPPSLAITAARFLVLRQAPAHQRFQ